MPISRDPGSAEPSFGFLSTLESPDYGHFGGYLIVSPLGRPLEFHCTSPVRPSRAQQILYGPTLQPYLIGEQISGPLFKAAKSRPSLIIVDAPVILTARPLAHAPMAFVTQQNQLDADSHNEITIAAGGYQLVLPVGFAGEENVVSQLATRLSQHVDLAEPFGRIHEAIREAQRIGERVVDGHGQAA